MGIQLFPKKKTGKHIIPFLAFNMSNPTIGKGKSGRHRPFSHYALSTGKKR